MATYVLVTPAIHPIVLRDFIETEQPTQTITIMMTHFPNHIVRPYSSIRLAAVLGAGICGSVIAGDAPSPDPIKPVVEVDSTSLMDKIWALPTIYKNDDNPMIQRFSFEGRLHADYVDFQGSPDNYEGAEWRRYRFGASAQVFQDFTLRVEVDFTDGEFNPNNLADAYNRLTDANLTWKPSKKFQLRAGKISAPFTLDGATSSKRLYTTERSTLTTNFWFPTEYFTGVAAKGKVDNWSYYAGAYSSSGDAEFTHFDSGYFGLLSLGYDLSGSTALDVSSVRMDYVYSNPDYSGDVGTRALEHIFSLSTKFEQGNCGIWSDIAIAKGLNEVGQGDLFGVTVMPFYTFNDTWQIAFRYSYVYSPDDNGVRLNRYENRAISGNVNEAHEWYLGVNTYIYGNKLKWQNGIEYIYAKDRANDGGEHQGWGFTSAVRMYF